MHGVAPGLVGLRVPHPVVWFCGLTSLELCFIWLHVLHCRAQRNPGRQEMVGNTRQSRTTQALLEKSFSTGHNRTARENLTTRDVRPERQTMRRGRLQWETVRRNALQLLMCTVPHHSCGMTAQRAWGEAIMYSFLCHAHTPLQYRVRSETASTSTQRKMMVDRRARGQEAGRQ